MEIGFQLSGGCLTALLASNFSSFVSELVQLPSVGYWKKREDVGLIEARGNSCVRSTVVDGIHSRGLDSDQKFSVSELLGRHRNGCRRRRSRRKIRLGTLMIEG